MNKWRLLGSSKPFDTQWFKVRQDKVELPNGKILDDYYVWESGDVSMVVPLTEDNKLILVKQYKHGASEIMIEYPAGYLGNENPESAAKREVEEETGYVINKINPLGKVIHHPTKETGCLHLFIAKVSELEKKNQRNLDQTEEIEILKLPINEVLEMIQNDEIWATATIAATFKALDYLNIITINVTSVQNAKKVQNDF